MTQTFDSLIHKSKSVLCILMMLFAPIYAVGCGQGGAFAPAADMALSGNDALTQQLAGTPFAGAKSIVIDRAAGTFRLIYDDDRMAVSGAIGTDPAGQSYVSSLTLVTDVRPVSFTLNESKQITSITSSRGIWTLADSTGARLASPSSTARNAALVDQFVAANAELLSQAKQADELSAAASGTAVPEKDGAASFAPLLWILGGVAFLPIGVFASIIWAIELVVIIQVIF